MAALSVALTPKGDLWLTFACATCGGPIDPGTGIGLYASTIGGPLLTVHSGIPCASGFGREFWWFPLSALPLLLRQSPQRAKQRRRHAA